MSTIDPGEWVGRGACGEVGGDLFYPELGAPMEQAKAVCRACEVRVECLGYALDRVDRFGIYGGFTERVRLRIAREVRAGRSLEDIIAEDDAAFYARVEAREALGRDEYERRQTGERRRRQEKRLAAAAAAASSTPQPRKVAA